MTSSTAAARDLLARCKQLRDEHRNEAVLRAEFQSWLRRVFPSPADDSWVNHYSEGAEAHAVIAMSGGDLAHRFIDTLIRSTVIEYEADLRQLPLREHGREQVREYIAAALRSGRPVSQVRGVLSDTVEWHVFEGRLPSGVNPATVTPADIELHEVESFAPAAVDDDTAKRFAVFLKKHLAREQSRALSAAHIAADLGLDSLAFSRHVDALLALVEDGRGADPSIALATDLWSRFVDGLERQEGVFRARVYVDELYIAVLARLLAANVLDGQASLSEDLELAEIVNGFYFSSRFRLKNMVEDDYFGWVLDEPYLSDLLRVAREIQRDLYAYDFSHLSEQDLFGRLMAQLARRSQRKLLGQEWTPTWLARAVAVRCLDKIPASDKPQLVDMCCGSGSIVAEVIKEVVSRNPDLHLEEVISSATGFDIDPLAVILARTTWVVTVAPRLKNAAADVIIPIYHADSLFAITPVSADVPPLGERADFVIDLDGEEIRLPAELIDPGRRMLFDDLVDWAYDEARAAADGTATSPTQERADSVIDALLSKHGIDTTKARRTRLAATAYRLAARMTTLAKARRNGIWAFILRNAYRPGLLAGQFNGLVSNPPWLAMSQLADNPYKEQLSRRALLYGVKPAGASHLHLELATTYLLHAIDRYLRPGAAVACLLPGTVFNGHHHQKLRNAAYLTSPRPVPFELQEVWEIAAGTFKVRSAAVVGVKRTTIDDVHSTPAGFHADEASVMPVDFEVRELGSRTAWVLAGNAAPLGTPATEEVPPQGADLMPRPAVCVDIIDDSGAEYRVRTPRPGSPLHFCVKDAKKLKGKDFTGFVAPQFLHRMVQSLNLLPFTLVEPFAPIALPAQRTAGGWSILDAAAMRAAGFVETARRFERIDRALAADHVVRPLADKINERNKLVAQVFPEDAYLVLNGAGGGLSCAACLRVRDYPDVVVDQTLYWRLVGTASEAWYRVGLLNSEAISQAIQPFNPQGEFGERHLHTLPHRVMPAFDPFNEDHVEISDLAQRIAVAAGQMAVAEPGFMDMAKSVAARRRGLRQQLRALPDLGRLEELCAAVLGTTPVDPAT
jgi:methylase of polypeptide subunit release factors